MKNAKILKILALALVACMAVALFTGCGSSEPTTSQVDPSASTDEDVFTAGDDLNVDLNLESSTVSTGNQNQSADVSKGDDDTISAEINSDAVEQQGGLMMTDNEEIFKKIPVKLKGKTVLFADWGECQGEYLKVIDKFTAVTGIKVKMLVYSSTDYITKVSQQIAAGSAPDIAGSNSTYPQALEVVQPLPSYFNINDGFWDPRVSEATKVGGKYYFVNTYNSPFTGGYVVYYNKRIYNNNGLTSPQDYLDRGQWSYENLFQCMKDAVKMGYKGGMIESMTLAEQMGVSIMNYDQKTGTFSGKTSDPRLVKAIQYMSKAVDEGLVGGTTAGFNNGQVGICMLGTYGLKYDGYFRDLAPSDIGVVPLPTSYDGKKLTYMPLGYRGYGICKGAQNGEAAYYFLRYYLDLNKFEPAGANVFANKVLEKYFRQTQLPLFQNSPLYFEYFQGALSLIGKPWNGGDWTTIRHAASDQVAVELSKMQNVVDAAAAAATAKVKEFT